ncbi:unnamed protein product [Vitrella brassicaformis CCMP3155]|uniref:Uncharacterized protein n=3 Tax=Vitrella brassicaformis TaxID=1169539 RepID=A0A0G4EKL3_VITBC|nr:unnamed protein product [Vitrella brassicaformis CCMP3155]|eukprot:CEL97661.1 unnamed protein product [Vitrella brassicaformis CCMP3155]
MASRTDPRAHLAQRIAARGLEMPDVYGDTPDLVCWKLKALMHQEPELLREWLVALRGTQEMRDTEAVIKRQDPTFLDTLLWEWFPQRVQHEAVQLVVDLFQHVPPQMLDDFAPLYSPFSLCQEPEIPLRQGPCIESVTREDSPVPAAVVAVLKQHMQDLHRKVESVSELKSELANSPQTDNDGLKQHVCGQFAALSNIVTKIADDVRHQRNTSSLADLAHAKCDMIAATIRQPSSYVCPLLIRLAELSVTSHIAPHLGTQAIVGSLSRTHTSLHALSHSPAMHTNMDLQRGRSDQTKLTGQQVAAWGPAFSRTTRARLDCNPSTRVFQLLEHASNTLQELHAHQSHRSVHIEDDCEGWDFGRDHIGPLDERLLFFGERIFPTPEESEAVVFPKLKRAEVDRHWRTVNTTKQDVTRGPWRKLRRWKMTSLVELHVHDTAPSSSGTISAATRPTFWSDLLQPTLKRITGVRFRGGVERFSPLEGAQVEELGVTLTEQLISDDLFESVDLFRDKSMAPNGKVTFDVTPSVVFHTMDNLSRMESHPSWADAVIEIARDVKIVALPSGLTQGQTVSSARLSCLRRLSFPHATTLELTGCGDASEPLPDVFLEHISHRHFPRITTLLLGWTERVREEPVSKAVDLPSLREVRFGREGSPPGRFFFPLCLRNCQKGLPLVHVEGIYRAGGAGAWSLWEGGGEGSGDGHQRVEKRIRKITLNVERQPEGSWVHEEGQPESSTVLSGILPACLRAIDKCPFLKCIVIEHGRVVKRDDGVGIFLIRRRPISLVTEADGEELQSRGFVAVRTCFAWKLCHVRDCVLHRRSEVSVCAVRMPRTAVDDSVSLNEALLSHAGLRVHPFAARCLEPEMRDKLTRKCVSYTDDLRREAKRNKDRRG